MIDTSNVRLHSFLSAKKIQRYFSRFKTNKLEMPQNEFIVYLLRGKNLYSFQLSAIDKASIQLKNKVKIELPLTVISDNRIDNEDELSEYLLDIVEYFDVGPAPGLLLLDTYYFFNMFLEEDTLDKVDLQIYSPHNSFDTVFSVDKPTDMPFWNLSYASESLLSSWGKCLQSTASKCAYIGSLFYPLIHEISIQYDSFGLLDLHNASATLLLYSNGRVISKFLPFGLNQYLNGDIFMVSEFVNRLTKSIVKASTDNSFSSPKNIFYLSDRGLDTSSSRFFNLQSVSDFLSVSYQKSMSMKVFEAAEVSDELFISLSLLSIVSLINVLES